MAVILPEGEDLNEWLAVNSALPVILTAWLVMIDAVGHSGRLLQSNQYALRHRHRVLHPSRMSRHVRWPEVRFGIYAVLSRES